MQEEYKKTNNEKTTRYGEFVCSLDHWLPIEKQKERSKKLANITNKKGTGIGNKKRKK